ncbi:MAG: RNA-binding S4 domain-containing protein [Bacteroidales bacterium]|nr:RNA-binding S4 domain-containing protein [Bacteroidales bacterium]
MEFELKGDTDYIELIKLLKAVNVAGSGAQAKLMVEAGDVSVDGHREYRKRAKIRRGSTVKIFDINILTK